MLREDDQKRFNQQIRRRKHLLKILNLSGASQTGDPSHIIVNLGKYAQDDFVYIHPHIGARIKPHQIEGVRFMWREVVMDRKNQQGCLLAHTMGLGKTMQM
jgi:SNF2 family DNA or RNA helicase